MKYWQLSILFFSFFIFNIGAQDNSWWNEKHQWDGVTPWNSYLIVSPAFMGPNALPVPEVQKGILPGKRSFELGMDGHYSKGDRTGNLFTELFFPLFSERAGLAISYVPLEYYQTDTLTRDLRRSREYDARGVSRGDFYFSTYIHLVKEHGWIPDILFTVNLKTASGTRFNAARHTDAPGYYFDFSAGKTIYTGDGNLRNIRAYAMSGLYVFQTNLGNYMQNDAFQYGAGLDLDFGRLRMDHQLGGYAGYLGNGDKPMVYRMNLAWIQGSVMEMKLRFQQGFIDFPYSTLRLSTLIHF
ncbi:MAG: hypothetical protein KAT15_12030 [Bacteroidales bacterium]|nr:hypothetical protein [Bacteroidales bacterium]